MSTRIPPIFKACFIAGLVPVVVAPLLWVLIKQGLSSISGLSNLESIASELSAVIVLSAIGGIGFCVVIGIPTLALMDHVKLNSPFIVGVIGAFEATLLLLLAGLGTDYEQTSETAWIAFVFIATLGFSCGSVASFLSSRNNNQT